MVNCGACGKFLSTAGAASCSACPAKYHRACLAITDKAQISKDWLCPLCKKNTKRGDNSQTPVKGIYENVEPEVPSSGPECSQPASSSHKDSPLENLDIMEFHRVFTDLTVEMRELRREMVIMRETLVDVTSRLAGAEQRLEALERRESSVGSGKIAELETTITELKMELNDRDQEALLADLEIGHLPEEKGENTFHCVAVLAGRLGVPLEERDVVFAERVGAPPAEAGGRPRRVVVRLARRHLRDQLLQAARVRRTGAQAQAAPRVFINERLTRSNKQLFHRVREECRRLQWRYAWTRRGRILAREGDGKPVFLFRAEGDLVRAFGPLSPKN